MNGYGDVAKALHVSGDTLTESIANGTVTVTNVNGSTVTVLVPNHPTIKAVKVTVPTPAPRRTRKGHMTAWTEYVTSAYRAERDSQQERCDEYAKGYTEDERLFYSEVEEKVTFKSILEHAKGYANHE